MENQNEIVLKINHKVECFIYRLKSSGYFDIRTLIGKKIDTSVRYNKLKPVEHFKT